MDVSKKEEMKMELTTKRLYIRSLCPDDWSSMKNIWDDFALSEFAQYDVPPKTDEGQIREFIENLGDSDLFFGVFPGDCGENKMIGFIDFHNTGNAYDMGYCFLSAYHGKGYAKESCRALIAYFSQKGIDKFTAGTALKNTPSVRLLHALGFVQTAEEKVSFYQDSDGNDIVFDGGLFELCPEKITEGKQAHGNLLNGIPHPQNKT